MTNLITAQESDVHRITKLSIYCTSILHSTISVKPHSLPIRVSRKSHFVNKFPNKYKCNFWSRFSPRILEIMWETTHSLSQAKLLTYQDFVSPCFVSAKQIAGMQYSHLLFPTVSLLNSSFCVRDTFPPLAGFHLLLEDSGLAKTGPSISDTYGTENRLPWMVKRILFLQHL